MSTPQGIKDDDFPPPPSPESEETPVAVPFSDEDIPF
jgi:hypothetical protein